MHHDLRKLRQLRLEPLPDPDRQPFAGRVVQPVYIVEVMVVELIVDRLKCRFDVTEVHHPARVGSQLTGQMDFDTERVPVQTRALVAFGHMRESMRSFEREDFEDIHLC